MGRIPDEDIQRVRDATDVVQIVSEKVVLKKKGRLYWGLCPFHGEKTPSFKVDPATQLWHCFGCGEGGDAFGFLMKTEQLEFPDAVRNLADRAHVEIREIGESAPRGHRQRLNEACDQAARFYHKVLVSSTERGAAAAREYLKGRGFGIETARRFEIGYAPGRGVLVAHLRGEGFSADEIVEANLGLRSDSGQLRDRFYERIMFPIRDVAGKAVGFGGRIIGSGEPKYLNTQETPVFHKSRNLYAIDRARNPIVTGKQALVVEGYTDVIALHEAGIENAVATLGTALTREHVKMLGRFASRVVYLFDADEAGLRAAERAIEFIDVAMASASSSAIELSVAVVPQGKDPADFVAAQGAEAMREVIGQARPLLEFVLERRMAVHDLKSPEGRARALADAASVLALVKGSLLAQDYTNYVADKLLTDYATVASAVERARPATPSQTADSGEEGSSAGIGHSRANAALSTAERAQRSLVGLVAANPVLRERARGLLTSDLLTDQMSCVLLEAVLESEGVPPEAIVTSLQERDPEAAVVLSGLLVDADGNEDVESIARELVHKLKDLALEREIREKKSHMNSLDPVKDRAAYDDLYREIGRLQVRRDRARREPIAEDDMEAWG